MNTKEDFLICLRKLSTEELYCLEQCIEKVRDERRVEAVNRVANAWAYLDEPQPRRIGAHVNINALPALTNDEINIAHAQGRLQAIREYRWRTHTGLVEAVAVIDNYMRAAGLMR